MPYYVAKDGKTWRLLYTEGKKTRAVSKRSPEAKKLGFAPELTLEQAQGRAEQLKSEAWVAREARKEERSRKVLERARKLRSAFLTDRDAEEFERTQLPRKKIRRTHWNTMQRILVDVQLHPSDWVENPEAIYEQFKKKRCSANYARKLLAYLNAWGYFVCKRHGKAWERVPGIPGEWVNRLESSRRDWFQEAEPLSPALLEEKKKALKPEHWRWLYLSVWFGLRPREVDNLREPNAKLWDLAKQGGVWVLSVFQEKLFERGVPEDDCWKHLPLVLPEQQAALPWLRGGERFERPVGAGGKLLRQVFGRGFSGYSGRNNFSGLLRDLGYDVETRAKWMGHLDLRTTLAYDRKTARKKAWLGRKAA